LLVGVAVGRKKADKRAAIRDKEMKRDMDRDAGRRR
jgi:tmRNA-binding protein